jgi:hypothetical protein
MDENERQYLRQQIRELERAKQRWKLLVFLLLAVVGSFLVAGAATLGGYGLFSIRRAREEAMRAQLEALRAQEAATRAVYEAQRARQAEDRAKAAKGKDARAPADGKPDRAAPGTGAPPRE